MALFQIGTTLVNSANYCRINCKSILRLLILILFSVVLMLSQESLNILLMHIVVLILLPGKSWCEKHLVSPSGTSNLFLNLLIIVSQSWNLSSLPWKVTNIHTILDWYEEEEAINDDRPLIDVSPHRWVWCFYHIY